MHDRERADTRVDPAQVDDRASLEPDTPESSPRAFRVRQPPTEGSVPDADRTAFREMLSYQRGRACVGQTILRVVTLQREAHLRTLDDGEHLLILVLQRQLCFWTASRDPLQRLHRRACAWLTEPGTGDPP